MEVKLEYKITLDKDSAEAGSGLITATITAPDGYYDHSIVAVLDTNDGTGDTPAKFTDSGIRITPRKFSSELTAQVEFKSDVEAEGYVTVLDTAYGTSSEQAHFTFTS